MVKDLYVLVLSGNGNESSTTIPYGSTLQAIGSGSGLYSRE